MHKNSVLFLTFVLACIGGALYYLGNLFYLPWTYWWYDIVLHFLVPLTGGLSLYWGFYQSGIIFRRRFESRFLSLALVFICVMAVAVGWEIFEYVNDLTDSHEGYPIDPIVDLAVGALGALLGGFVGLKKDHG